MADVKVGDVVVRVAFPHGSVAQDEGVVVNVQRMRADGVLCTSVIALHVRFGTGLVETVAPWSVALKAADRGGGQ